MIIDGHVHADSALPPGELIKIMDRDGIDKAVLLAPYSTVRAPDVSPWLAALFRFLLHSSLFHRIGLSTYNGMHHYDQKVDDEIYPIALKVGGKWMKLEKYPDNNKVLKAYKRYPERFIPFVFINPTGNPRFVDQFEHYVEEENFKGVKILPWSHGFDLCGDFLVVAKRCEQKKIPILIHTGSTPETGNVELLLKKCPELKIILAHGGVPFFKRNWQLARKYRNLFLDISGPFFVSLSVAKKMLKVVGPEKLIFGSDGEPGLRLKEKGHGYEERKKLVESMSISEKEKEMIYRGNLLSILEG